MIQTAVVKRVVAPSVVEITLLRQLECGLNCPSCESCPQRPTEELFAMAKNEVNARPGDMVEVRPNAGSSTGVAAFVFILPCVMLILGYLVGTLFRLSDGLCILFAFFGLFLGILPAVFKDRSVRAKNEPEFTILSVLE